MEPCCSTKPTLYKQTAEDDLFSRLYLITFKEVNYPAHQEVYFLNRLIME